MAEDWQMILGTAMQHMRKLCKTCQCNGCHLLQRDFTPSTLHLQRGVFVAPHSTHACMHGTAFLNTEGVIHAHIMQALP